MKILNIFKATRENIDLLKGLNHSETTLSYIAKLDAKREQLARREARQAKEDRINNWQDRYYVPKHD